MGVAEAASASKTVMANWLMPYVRVGSERREATRWFMRHGRAGAGTRVYLTEVRHE